jgi:hypothetical protein
VKDIAGWAFHGTGVHDIHDAWSVVHTLGWRTTMGWKRFRVFLAPSISANYCRDK